MHYLASVRLHRDLTDADFSTDLLIQQAGDHQVHDLPFPTRKGRVAVPQRAHLRLVIKGCTTAFQGLPDGAQQHGIAVYRENRTDVASYDPFRFGKIDDRVVSEQINSTLGADPKISFSILKEGIYIIIGQPIGAPIVIDDAVVNMIETIRLGADPQRLFLIDKDNGVSELSPVESWNDVARPFPIHYRYVRPIDLSS